jgi:hypothetical protein
LNESWGGDNWFANWVLPDPAANWHAAQSGAAAMVNAKGGINKTIGGLTLLSSSIFLVTDFIPGENVAKNALKKGAEEVAEHVTKNFVAREGKKTLENVGQKTAKETSEQTQKKVAALEVNSKGALDRKAASGDGLQHHEIPSNAAVVKNLEEKLERKLSGAERAAIQKENTAVAIPDAIHRDLATTGGRNRALSGSDAKDLRSAERRDLRELIQKTDSAGMDRDEIARAARDVRNRNRDRGM